MSSDLTATSQDPSSLMRILRPLLPTLFTVGRIVCGFAAVVLTFNGMRSMGATETSALGILGFDNAAKAIGFGILCDALDGKIARLVGSDSRFGRELDSIADVVTFGLATSVLLFFWGVMAVHDVVGASPAGPLYWAGWIAACVFLICGAGRLARFNLGGERPANSHGHSDGLSIPSAAGVIAAVVHYIKVPITNFEYAMGWLGVVMVLSLLMISSIRYDPLAAIPRRLRKPIFSVPFALLFVWSLWNHSEPVLLLVAVGNSIWGPFAYVFSRLRAQTRLAHM
jgi:CDP-diacylglycerol--serine O-phosphatidyltransferase